MKETTAQDIAGRPIKIVASNLKAWSATVEFADTGEQIENCQRIDLDMDVEKPHILAKVYLLRMDKTRLPHDPYYREVGETDKVELSTLARVEGTE